MARPQPRVADSDGAMQDEDGEECMQLVDTWSTKYMVHTTSNLTMLASFRLPKVDALMKACREIPEDQRWGMPIDIKSLPQGGIWQDSYIKSRLLRETMYGGVQHRPEEKLPRIFQNQRAENKGQLLNTRYAGGDRWDSLKGKIREFKEPIIPAVASEGVDMPRGRVPTPPSAHEFYNHLKQADPETYLIYRKHLEQLQKEAASNEEELIATRKKLRESAMPQPISRRIPASVMEPSPSLSLPTPIVRNLNGEDMPPLTPNDDQMDDIESID